MTSNLTVDKNSLIERVVDYAQGRSELKDDAEVFALIANLPIVREYQAQNSRLKAEVAEMKELFRFLESDADSFVKMWISFKEAMKRR